MESTTPIIFFVYRSGGDYDKEDVKNMIWQINRFTSIDCDIVCLSNDESVADELLITNLDRWWSKIELFRFYNRPIIYFDLDIVILRNIDNLLKNVVLLKNNEFVMMESCADTVIVEKSFSSSLMMWNGDFKFLFDEFTIENMKLRTDQTYISHKLQDKNINIKMITDFVNVYGWNSKCSFGIPQDTDIINFYSNPRPRDIGLPYWGRHLINNNKKK